MGYAVKGALLSALENMAVCDRTLFIASLAVC